MSFSPGQIITAQRLNRLAPATYWAQASGGVAASSSGVDVPGSSMSITVQTNGATANMWFYGHFYAGASAPTTNGAIQAVWDVNSSPTFGVVDIRTANEKFTGANSWSTSIPAAGTYTFKLKVTTPANVTMPTYSSLLVQIQEVA